MGTDRTPFISGWNVTAMMARRAAQRALDFILPPVCPACEAPLADQRGICMRCWSQLNFIERPYCERLGVPLSFDLGPGALSAGAIAEPPVFDRARAVCLHGDISRVLVHGLKYRDRMELAPVMGEWMARAGRELLAETDLIVPVPLHRRRLWQRRFNQSAELARAVGRVSATPVVSDALLRIRPTRRQVGLNAGERARNVRAAFRINPEHAAMLSGRKVLLVDDVYTTGATVEACTRALRRARVTSIDVLTFARVSPMGE